MSYKRLTTACLAEQAGTCAGQAATLGRASLYQQRRQRLKYPAAPVLKKQQCRAGSHSNSAEQCLTAVATLVLHHCHHHRYHQHHHCHNGTVIIVIITNIIAIIIAIDIISITTIENPLHHHDLPPPPLHPQLHQLHRPLPCNTTYRPHSSISIFIIIATFLHFTNQLQPGKKKTRWQSSKSPTFLLAWISVT
eukprot:scaffold258815_cov21-Tisochrysis_lutea.AAC.1